MLNTIITNDVRQTLDHFRRSVDQMFDNFYGQPQQPSQPPSGMTSERAVTFSPALESGWNDHNLRLRAILPGISEQDVNVTVRNNQLILTGERKAPEGWTKNAHTQLAYGKFYTAVTLPNGLDLEHVACRLQNGILEIDVPMAETSKPRQIQIQIGEERKSINS
jgi:HSP20 family protein